MVWYGYFLELPNTSCWELLTSLMTRQLTINNKNNKCIIIGCLITHIGWFQKISIPYHGWHEYFNSPLPSEIPKCLSPPCPPNSKIANPPFSSGIFHFCFRPFGIPVRLPINLQTNEKLALFPSAKELAIKEGGRPTQLLPHAKMLLIPIKLFLSAG